MAAPKPLAGPDKRQNRPGSRQDGKKSRQDVSRPVTTQPVPILFPERECARTACRRKFRPTKRPDQRYHAESCRKKAHLERLQDDAIRARDREWTEKVLGIEGQILNPDDAAVWLKRDRSNQVANVVDATRFKGAPKWS